MGSLTNSIEDWFLRHQWVFPWGWVLMQRGGLSRDVKPKLLIGRENICLEGGGGRGGEDHSY